VPIKPITRSKVKKLKETLKRLVQDIWVKINFKKATTLMEQPKINLIQMHERPNSSTLWV